MGVVMRRSIFLGLLLTLGCSNIPEPPGKALQSSLTRIDAAAAPAGLSAVVEGNTAAALDLHRTLIEGDENFVFSPWSITSVLGRAHGGARGETGTELETFLRAQNAVDYHRAMNHLELALASRGRSSQGADGEPFALVNLNQVFVDPKLNVESGYLDLLQQEYGDGARQLDFATKPGEATKQVNEWVSKATRGRIPELLGAEDVNDRTRLVLVNAMYFSSAWASNFSENTTQEPFHGLAGDAATTMMRNASFSAGELENTELQAVELNYSGGELSMLIIMPKTDYRAWEATLDVSALKHVREGLTGTLVDLSMPKWETRARRDLLPALEQRGLKKLFTAGEADLSGISATDPLFLEFLRHEAWIDVSPSGTRAAAATGGGFSLAPSAPPQPKRVIIDRPFFYVIQDNTTKTVLFAGRFVKP
jgi:serpin B